MDRNRSTLGPLLLLAMATTWILGAAGSSPLREPAPERFTPEAAERMSRAAAGRLRPVYSPLAAWIVERCGIAEAGGIGIDLGSGPGDLIVELCRRTRLHWVNADINPHFFPIFAARLEAAGLRGRASAIFADAHALPFRNGYARAIVSRGSLPFWSDWRTAFREVHRVLAPGGVAFIGRGFPPTLDVDVARRIRRGGGAPPYDPDETEATLRALLTAMGVSDLRIHRPRPPASDGVNYGVWVEFRK